MKIAAISVFAALALIGGGQALAATHHQATPKTLVVAMHDPGCHWFLVHGKYTTSANVKGPIALKNEDEAALIVVTKTTTQHVAVNKSLVLHHGNYVVMMVHQANDDNHLKLTVR